MLAKIISALALTLLLTGGALAYIPQPDNINAGQNVFAENTVLSEPQPHNIIYTGQATAYSRSKVCGLSCFGKRRGIRATAAQHLCGS